MDKFYVIQTSSIALTSKSSAGNEGNPSQTTRESKKSCLLGIDTSFTSSPAGFGLDEEVDKEQAWKKSSKGNSQVSTELNLKGKGVGGEVNGEGRGGSDESGGRNSSLGEGSSSNCRKETRSW